MFHLVKNFANFSDKRVTFLQTLLYYDFFLKFAASFLFYKDFPVIEKVKI